MRPFEINLAFLLWPVVEPERPFSKARLDLAGCAAYALAATIHARPFKDSRQESKRSAG
jgi:hypothetical protein